MERVLWVFVVALLAVNVTLMVQRKQNDARFQDLRQESSTAQIKVKYAAEEEMILTGVGTVPAAFPRSREQSGDSVQFVLLASVKDCTNSIEDEVAKLNELSLRNSSRMAGIQGFFVDEDQRRKAETFIAHLSPAPVFPMSVKNALSQLPEATTPLVLVLRSRDGRILDAHKPIPEDLTKRDAFYARWTAALGII